MTTRHRTLAVLLLLLLLVACSPTATIVPEQVPSAVPPTAKVVPTAEPTVPPPGPTAVPAAITIDSPQTEATITSPVEVRGMVAVVPFESNLLGQVYDASGRVVGAGPIMVQGSMGDEGPKPFVGSIAFTPTVDGAGRIEVAEISPKDGSILNSATVSVLLTAAAAAIETPTAGAQAVLPLHIQARGGRPGDQVVASLLWQDGSVLERTYTLTEGEDGRGLLIESLWWQADVPPLPFPPTQPATLEIHTPDGTVLARQELTVISWDDSAALQQVTVYFLLGEELQAVTMNVPQTARIGAAALEMLLWGPPANSEAGFGTALPQPQDVLSFPGRGPGWGPRVRLLDLTIEGGVATANFSREFAAYGGGSTRVMLIREQITRTLKEFPTVNEVVIAVEGETEAVLEP